MCVYSHVIIEHLIMYSCCCPNGVCGDSLCCVGSHISMCVQELPCAEKEKVIEYLSKKYSSVYHQLRARARARARAIKISDINACLTDPKAKLMRSPTN